MRRSFRTAVVHVGTIALALSSFVRPVNAADGLVSLAQLAPQLGYTFTWIAAEDAVALTRPGLYVLVRTGNPLYDVNDSIEQAAPAPQSRNADIYVGSAMVKRLRTLAVQYAPHPDRPDAAAPRPIVSGPVLGALTLAAVPTGIADAVVVSGTGPANVPLSITLSADISRDIPRVLLSRTSAQTNAAGTFSVEIPTAPLHLQRSTVLVSATSLAGVTAAYTSFVLDVPSPTMAHSVEEPPRDFRPHR